MLTIYVRFNGSSKKYGALLCTVRKLRRNIYEDKSLMRNQENTKKKRTHDFLFTISYHPLISHEKQGEKESWLTSTRVMNDEFNQRDAAQH